MTRIANHFTKRHNLTAFNTSWDYSAAVTAEFDRLAWQYHTNARNVDNGNEKVMQNSPTWQVYSPITTKNVGPNDCINVGHYWPYTRWICIMVLMDAYINYGFQDGWNGEQSVSKFPFERPLPPKVTLTRTQNVLSWALDGQASQMGDTSNRNRCRMRWYVQRVVEGSKYPDIKLYDPSGFNNTRSGDWSTTPAGFKGATGTRSSAPDNNVTVTFTENNVSPDRSYAVRLVAYNDGFSGATAAESVEHVFCKPNKPKVTQNRSNETEVAFDVDARWSYWHQCEKMELRYQVGSVLDPNGQWNRAGDEYTNVNGIKLARMLTDRRPERIPPTDKATWYRVVTTHDDAANVGVSDILPSSYVSPPAAPTISSCEWQSDHTVQLSVTKNSNMDVDTYVSVTNLTNDLPKNNVEPYKVEGELSSFLIQKNGAPMHFDIHSVYRITVYNQLVNREGASNMYAMNGNLSQPLPQSEPAVQEVRGSTGAVAKASLGAITITRVTTNPSGHGITLEWTAEPDKLTITYDDIGTFIEWTDADGGWISTETPKSHKVTDSGNFGEEEDEGEGTSVNQGIVSIDGLTEGTTYQVRLRRYVTLDGEDGYGPDATTSATSWSTPNKPVLSAPGYVLPGESVRYTWTFTDEGDTPQSAAQLTVNDNPYAVDGSAGSFVLDVPDSMEGETLTATVSVAANGAFSEASDEVVTTVAERPTCTLALPSCETSTDYGGKTLTALPLTVTVGGSGDTFRVRVTSNGGAFSPEPAGGRELAAGEVVATEVYSGAGTYEVDGSMIIGGGNYDVECVCVDTTTGMESDPVTRGFTALWADAAVIPSGTVEIEDGQAYITPVEGADAPEGETVRIWRKVADGYVLACENAIWGERHLDRVPAYGSDELAYVIEAVSADGDHKWAEVPYTLAGTDARITFGGQTVSLPWNLQPKSSYAKGFERRVHMDGHRAGFWEPGVDRDWALSSGYLRDDRAHTDELREVGRYDGLCYVRGPRGVGFAANVDVDVSLTYDSAEANVDITCAEVADDGTYAIVVEPRDEDEGEGA